MRNRILCVFSGILWLAVLGIAPTHGETRSQVKVDIPFEFNIGNRTMPAGKYHVGPIQEVQQSLVVQSEDGRAIAIALIHPVQARTQKAGAKLVFNRYGNRYFLSQVWSGLDNMGSELPKTNNERELAKTAVKIDRPILLAQRR